jgi:hypothetical protein
VRKEEDDGVTHMETLLSCREERPREEERVINKRRRRRAMESST